MKNQVTRTVDRAEVVEFFGSFAEVREFLFNWVNEISLETTSEDMEKFMAEFGFKDTEEAVIWLFDLFPSLGVYTREL